MDSEEELRFYVAVRAGRYPCRFNVALVNYPTVTIHNLYFLKISWRHLGQREILRMSFHPA